MNNRILLGIILFSFLLVACPSAEVGDPMPITVDVTSVILKRQFDAFSPEQQKRVTTYLKDINKTNRERIIKLAKEAREKNIAIKTSPNMDSPSSLEAPSREGEFSSREAKEDSDLEELSIDEHQKRYPCPEIKGAETQLDESECNYILNNISLPDEGCAYGGACIGLFKHHFDADPPPNFRDFKTRGIKFINIPKGVVVDNAQLIKESEMGLQSGDNNIYSPSDHVNFNDTYSIELTLSEI